MTQNNSDFDDAAIGCISSILLYLFQSLVLTLAYNGIIVDKLHLGEIHLTFGYALLLAFAIRIVFADFSSD